MRLLTGANSRYGSIASFPRRPLSRPLFPGSDITPLGRPSRLSGCSVQLGRASAPTIPQRVQTMRGAEARHVHKLAGPTHIAARVRVADKAQKGFGLAGPLLSLCRTGVGAGHSIPA